MAGRGCQQQICHRPTYGSLSKEFPDTLGLVHTRLLGFAWDAYYPVFITRPQLGSPMKKISITMPLDQHQLAPFKKLARILRTHLDGILVWVKLRVSNGALEGLNNKVKVISHRAYGYRTTLTYMANTYHGCAGLPQP